MRLQNILNLTVWVFFFVSCSRKENSDYEAQEKELDIIVYLLQKSVKDNQLLLNVKLKNISGDTIFILSEKSTYFHRQFQFDITSDGKHYVFQNRKNTYSSFRDSIMLLDKDTITFKLNLIDNYISSTQNIEDFLKDGQLRCYFDANLEFIESSEYPYKIKLIGKNVSNQLRLN